MAAKLAEMVTNGAAGLAHSGGAMSAAEQMAYVKSRLEEAEADLEAARAIGALRSERVGELEEQLRHATLSDGPALTAFRNKVRRRRLEEQGGRSPTKYRLDSVRWRAWRSSCSRRRRKPLRSARRARTPRSSSK